MNYRILEIYKSKFGVIFLLYIDYSGDWWDHYKKTKKYNIFTTKS